MASPIISERAFEFALRIVALSKRLSSRDATGRHMASQLLKCGTSIGANVEEAQEGQTKPDFIAKLSVARKETRETIFWLRLARASGVSTIDETAWELDEARQLLAMIVKAIRTAQASPARGQNG